MAHKTLIDGTSYEISGGKTLVGGTEYGIQGGRTLIGGTGYDIPVAVASDCTITINGGSKGGGTTAQTCHKAYVLYNGTKYINTSLIVPVGESITIHLEMGTFKLAFKNYEAYPDVRYEYIAADGTEVSYNSGPRYAPLTKTLVIESDTTIRFGYMTGEVTD